MDPAARAIAAGTLRRFGTPAWLRARVAHTQNGRTMVGGTGGTADVAAGRQADAEVTEPVQAEAQECVLVEGRAALCPVAVRRGRGGNHPDRSDAGGDVAARPALRSGRSRPRQ